MGEHREGPYIAAAAICEHLIQDNRGVLSLIGIIDRVTITASGPKAPDKMPPTPVNVKLVVMLKSGGARGTHELALQVEAPDGSHGPKQCQTCHLEGEDRGFNWIVNTALTVNQEGLYWFEVLLDDRLITRIPLRLLYQRTTTR
jgi:hypothetical protein